MLINNVSKDKLSIKRYISISIFDIEEQDKSSDIDQQPPLADRK